MLSTNEHFIYKPVKKNDEIINCYFSEKLNFGFRIEKVHSTSQQCYFCSNYYVSKDKYDRHIQNSAGQLGFAHNFKTQNLLHFEENIKYKGDIPLGAYIDFETTALRNKFRSRKQKNVCDYFCISSRIKY